MLCFASLLRMRDFKSLDGRGSRIRTCDLKYPKLPRYRAALYPVFARVANMGRTSEQGRCGSVMGAPPGLASPASRDDVGFAPRLRCHQRRLQHLGALTEIPSGGSSLSHATPHCAAAPPARASATELPSGRIRCGLLFWRARWRRAATCPNMTSPETSVAIQKIHARRYSQAFVIFPLHTDNGASLSSNSGSRDFKRRGPRRGQLARKSLCPT